MSDRVRCYLAGLCHGVAGAWIVAWLLYKASVPSSALLGPRGVLPVVLALTIATASLPLLLAFRGSSSDDEAGPRT